MLTFHDAWAGDTQKSRPDPDENRGSDRGAHLRAYRFKPGNRAKAGKSCRLDRVIKEMLIKNALCAADTLYKITTNRRASPEARCLAALAVLQRVYGVCFGQPVPPRLWQPVRHGNRPDRYGSGIDRLVREMLRDNSIAAARSLCDAVKAPNAPFIRRFHASDAVLDRVYGKPLLPIDAVCGRKDKAAAEKPRAGGFRPGVSGNPGGRRKYDPKVKNILVTGMIPAARTLCELVGDPKTPPCVCVFAAGAMLEGCMREAGLV